MTFVRIDGDGEAIPISDKVKKKYARELTAQELEKEEEKLYEVYGGD